MPTPDMPDFLRDLFGLDGRPPIDPCEQPRPKAPDSDLQLADKVVSHIEAWVDTRSVNELRKARFHLDRLIAKQE